MDVKELDKKQLILLTLLITFVVSIGTGIVTVSLMKQMPQSIPQTINNVIQRTIEKVSTVEVPSTTKIINNDVVAPQNNSSLIANNSDALVNIYSNKVNAVTPVIDTNSVTTTAVDTTSTTAPNIIGQGIIISDIGLILVDSSILTEQGSYKVILNKKDFNVSVLKSFGNGFTVLKISSITNKTTGSTNTSSKTQ